MILSNKVYDMLKWITLILLPAFGVLYLALANVWGLPYGTQVVETLAAIDLFLAALLGISTNSFKVSHPMYRLSLVKMAGDTHNRWVLSTDAYDVLSWIAQILLPGLATFYAALSVVWGFPLAEQVVSTIMAVDAFLGMLLGFSTAQFHKSVAQTCVDTPEAWLDGE